MYKSNTLTFFKNLYFEMLQTREYTFGLKVVALKKYNVSFNFYIVIITCCQLVYIVVGWKLHYALTYLDAILNKCCFEQDVVSSLLPELLLTNFVICILLLILVAEAQKLPI